MDLILVILENIIANIVAGVSLPTYHVTKFSDLSSQTKTCERDDTYMEYNDFVYFFIIVLHRYICCACMNIAYNFTFQVQHQDYAIN